jgi:hypothetical protein
VLVELKRNMGPIAFSAQYQQSPVPPGGAIIKRKWLKYKSEREAMLFAIDAAQKLGQQDEPTEVLVDG